MYPSLVLYLNVTVADPPTITENFILLERGVGFNVIVIVYGSLIANLLLLGQKYFSSNSSPLLH